MNENIFSKFILPFPIYIFLLIMLKFYLDIVFLLPVLEKKQTNNERENQTYTHKQH